MLDFFRHLGSLLAREAGEQKIVILIDEFDGIPRAALRGFLHTIRHIYLTDAPRCPHTVRIVGVKNITQLDYEGYYAVFDHRQHPEPRAETETVDGVTIRSYVIPVMQEKPSESSQTA